MFRGSGQQHIGSLPSLPKCAIYSHDIWQASSTGRIRTLIGGIHRLAILSIYFLVVGLRPFLIRLFSLLGHKTRHISIIKVCPLQSCSVPFINMYGGHFIYWCFVDDLRPFLIPDFHVFSCWTSYVCKSFCYRHWPYIFHPQISTLLSLLT